MRKSPGHRFKYCGHGNIRILERERQECPFCRRETKRSEKMDRDRGDRGNREMFDAVCSDCGQPCQVPFKPTEGRPVYCRECFRKHRKF